MSCGSHVSAEYYYTYYNIVPCLHGLMVLWVSCECMLLSILCVQHVRAECIYLCPVVSCNTWFTSIMIMMFQYT